MNRAPRNILLAVLFVLPCASHAAEICTNIDLPLPATTEGLYVDLVTGAHEESESAAPGFDIDIYAAASTTPSGQLKFYWGSAPTNGAGVAIEGDTYAVLGGGALIGPASLFTRQGFTGITTAWQAGTTGYLGLRFRNEAAGNATHYGWLALTTTAPLGFPAHILGWCYEDSGALIVTPAPDTFFANGFDT